jgi:hypothetical protein
VRQRDNPGYSQLFVIGIIPTAEQLVLILGSGKGLGEALLETE